MGYKPKYAADTRKRETQIIRRKAPERREKHAPRPRSRGGRIARLCLTAVLVPLCAVITARQLGQMVRTVGIPKAVSLAAAKDMTAVDTLDQFAREKTEKAAQTLNRMDTSDFTLPVEETEPYHEHYTIAQDAAAAPAPDRSLFGSVRNPADMEPVIEQAKWVLDGQTMYFQTDQKIYEDSPIRYYLDETIFAVTWQEVHDDSVYTFSEIKVEDASQFRRHLAGGEYGSNIQYLTTEMAESVNAVVASAGDFYRFRDFGAVVYQGQAKRVEGTYAETCYIDRSGNMHFTRAGEVLTTQDVQRYVDENDINFSLAFGPILVDNYELQNHTWYGVGEINEGYARAALCQMDELHYLLATANTTGVHQTIPTVAMFARNIAATGCRMAYCLDGGQTATIVMNNELMNRPVFGQQRKISDIIYFATAVPEGGTDNG